jgi:hypothetical protein
MALVILSSVIAPQGQVPLVRYFDSLEALLASNPNNPNTSVYVKGPRGGPFYYHPTLGGVTNAFTTFGTLLGGATRWRRQTDSDDIRIAWGGPVTRDTIQAALDLIKLNARGGRALLPNGRSANIDCTTPILVPDNVALEGEDGAIFGQLPGQANKKAIRLLGTSNSRVANFAFELWVGNGNAAFDVENVTNCVIAGITGLRPGEWGALGTNVSRANALRVFDKIGRENTPDAFGGVPDDTVDNTLPIQLALNHAGGRYGKASLGEGKYAFDSTLYVLGGTVFEGQALGENFSGNNLHYRGTTGTALSVGGSTILRNIHLQGPGAGADPSHIGYTYTNKGIVFTPGPSTGANDFELDNCKMYYFGTGIEFGTTNFTATILNARVVRCGVGVMMTNSYCNIINWHGGMIANCYDAFIGAPSAIMQSVILDAITLQSFYRGITINAESRSVILQNLYFENFNDAEIKSGVFSGTAESGSTTTINDTDMSWTPNQWVGFTVWVSAGGGYVANPPSYSTITANTATQLSFSPALTAPADATTIYHILNQDNEYDIRLNHPSLATSLSATKISGCTFYGSRTNVFLGRQYKTTIENCDLRAQYPTGTPIDIETTSSNATIKENSYAFNPWSKYDVHNRGTSTSQVDNNIFTSGAIIAGDHSGASDYGTRSSFTLLPQRVPNVQGTATTNNIAGVAAGVFDGTNNIRTALFSDNVYKEFGVAGKGTVAGTLVLRNQDVEGLRIDSAGLVTVSNKLGIGIAPAEPLLTTFNNESNSLAVWFKNTNSGLLLRQKQLDGSYAGNIWYPQGNASKHAWGNSAETVIMDLNPTTGTLTVSNGVTTGGIIGTATGMTSGGYVYSDTAKFTNGHSGVLKVTGGAASTSLWLTDGVNSSLLVNHSPTNNAAIIYAGGSSQNIQIGNNLAQPIVTFDNSGDIKANGYLTLSGLTNRITDNGTTLAYNGTAIGGGAAAVTHTITTNNAVQNFVSFTIPNHETGGAKITYLCESGDGTEAQSDFGTIDVSMAYNSTDTDAKASFTTYQSGPVKTGASTYTVSFSRVVAAGVTTLQVNANSSLTTTFSRIKYKVETFGNVTVTNL